MPLFSDILVFILLHKILNLKRINPVFKKIDKMSFVLSINYL
jgi:hypothetical protein